ncbi:MAG: carbohydrate ABC transporter permease [Clostridia bacterium]|nr:carbohydrate ABC transporter permease [Clostridia bacterium]
MKTKKYIGTIFAYIFLAILFLFVIFPIFCTAMSSLKTNFEILKNPGSIIPESFTFDNYVQAWKIADFSKYTFNSIYMAFFIVLGTLFFSTMAGYSFARSNFRGKNKLFLMLTCTMFLGFGSITIYPTLEIAKFLHINNSLWGVILSTVLGANVINLFLVRNYIMGLDLAIEEAAEIDGCNFIMRFFLIVLPILRPIIATIGILSFQGAWNNYLLPMVFTLGNPKAAPLTVGIVALKGSGQGAASWNLMLAGTMISIVPMIIVYLIFNKQFIHGLTSGGVKG